MARSIAPARAWEPFRSPLAPLAVGLAVALFAIALFAILYRSSPPNPEAQSTFSESEVLTLVARDMRSGDAALRVVNSGKARFENGTWLITVGDAQFHFSQRNRVVVADNDAARDLEFRDAPR